MKYYECIDKLNRLQEKYDKLIKFIIKSLKRLDGEIFDNVDFETTVKIRALIVKFENLVIK